MPSLQVLGGCGDMVQGRCQLHRGFGPPSAALLPASDVLGDFCLWVALQLSTGGAACAQQRLSNTSNAAKQSESGGGAGSAKQNLDGCRWKPRRANKTWDRGSLLAIEEMQSEQPLVSCCAKVVQL